MTPDDLVTWLAGRPPRLGVTLSVELQVQGSGTVWLTLLDGVVSGAGDGSADAPDLTVILAAAEAEAILAGTTDLAVAYMQGTAKVVGKTSDLLDLLEVVAPAR